MQIDYKFDNSSIVKAFKRLDKLGWIRPVPRS